MTYAHDIGNGQRLLIENDGDHTQVALSSGDSGQHQNQSTGFSTGKWSKAPELFRISEKLVLRLESKSGTERDPDAVVKWDTNTVKRTAFSVPFQKLRFHQSRFMAENLHRLV